MSAAPIALLTDFGTSDWYVAEMKGALLTGAPGATLVDVTHDVAPGDVAQGAFLLARVHEAFPAGTVFLAVVDPGVGTARNPIAVRAEARYFVGPDNGLLEAALDGDGAVTRTIDDAALLARASHTFHGRDVFAPAAARIATGGDAAWQALGRVLASPVRLAPLWAGGVDHPHPARLAERAQGARLATRVAHVDRFGNAILHLHARDLAAWMGGAKADDLVVRAHGARGERVTEIRGLAQTYGAPAAGAPGTTAADRPGAPDEPRPLVLVGSSGLLEIALAGGHAALALGLAPGDAIELTIENAPRL